MPLVAAALLHLAKLTVGTSFIIIDNGNQIAQELIQAIIADYRTAIVRKGTYMVILVERQALILDIHIVAEDSYGHQCHYIA